MAVPFSFLARHVRYNGIAMIKLIIFDMDGLLLDSERQMYSKLGVEVSTKLGDPISVEFLTALMGNGWDIYERRIAEHKGKDFPIKEYMRLMNEGIAYTIENVPIPMMPGAMEVLDYCKKHGYLMAIATSTHKKQAYRCLKNAGILEYFDHIVTGDQVEKGKPDPEIYLKTLDYFKIDKSQALVLEDGHNGSRAALSAGIRLALIEDMAYVSEEDRKEAFLHSHDIRDVIPMLEKENEGATGQ